MTRRRSNSEIRQREKVKKKNEKKKSSLVLVVASLRSLLHFSFWLLLRLRLAPSSTNRLERPKSSMYPSASILAMAMVVDFGRHRYHYYYQDPSQQLTAAGVAATAAVLPTGLSASLSVHLFAGRTVAEYRIIQRHACPLLSLLLGLACRRWYLYQWWIRTQFCCCGCDWLLLPFSDIRRYALHRIVFVTIAATATQDGLLASYRSFPLGMKRCDA